AWGTRVRGAASRRVQPVVRRYGSGMRGGLVVTDDSAGLEAFAGPVVSLGMTDDSEGHRPLREVRAYQVVADSGCACAGRGGGVGAERWRRHPDGRTGREQTKEARLCGAGDGGRAGGAGEGRGDGGRKAAKALVTTSERDANSY